MPKRALIILAAVAAGLGVWFLFFRRTVQAQVNGSNVAAPPTPQGALAQLQQAVGAAVGQKVEGVTYRALDTVGTAIVSNLPGSTSGGGKSGPITAKCPPGFKGNHPDDPRLYCAGDTQCPPEGGGMLCSALRAVQKINPVVTYAPSVGYYG